MPAWMDLSNYALTSFAAQTLTVACAIAALGMIVLWRERWSVEGILFWLCTFAISIWLFSFSFMYSSMREDVALHWAKTAYIGVPFIPSAIYHFSVVVLRVGTRQRRRLVFSWLIAGFFAYTILTTDFLIARLYKYPWGYYPKYEWLGTPYIIFFFGLMVVTLKHYWTEFRRTEKGSRAYHRAKELFVAFSIAYLGSIDFLPKYGIPIHPIGYVFIFCFLVLAANVIWKYRLVDITPAFAADQIIQTMNEPLIVCDLRGKIRIVNPSYSRVFGYEEADVHGRMVADLTAGDGDWMRKMIADGNVKNHECSFLTKGGARIFVSLSASELKTADGRPEGFVIVARDVTERRHMEQELKTFNETLEQAVSKRTKELANKIQELEWLNMVMMGREERILELKEQVRVLENARKAAANADH